MTNATPREIPINVCPALDEADTDPLVETLKDHRTIKHVLDQCLSQSPSLEFSDLVKQDEYTHDFIVPYRDGIHLVYDTTWVGEVMAVTIWDHCPTVQELLDTRVAKGWKPTPSLLRDGQRVLGFASCIFDAHGQSESAGCEQRG